MASLLPSFVAHTLLSRETSYNDAKNFRDSCTLATCPLRLSYWGYLPSLPANALFLAVFALSTILFIGQGVLSRRFIGFSVAMISGCALEVIGYVGRVMSHKNPFAEVSISPNVFIDVCIKEHRLINCNRIRF